MNIYEYRLLLGAKKRFMTIDELLLSSEFDWSSGKNRKDVAMELCQDFMLRHPHLTNPDVLVGSVLMLRGRIQDMDILLCRSSARKVGDLCDLIGGVWDSALKRNHRMAEIRHLLFTGRGWWDIEAEFELNTLYSYIRIGCVDLDMREVRCGWKMAHFFMPPHIKPWPKCDSSIYYNLKLLCDYGWVNKFKSHTLGNSFSVTNKDPGARLGAPPQLLLPRGPAAG